MRNRRGLSSMVGAVFFIIAMTIAIGYISFSMDTLDQFAQTVIVKAAVKEDQSNEEFEVNKVTIDGNLFNITVTNVGQIPIKITRLWVEDVTSGVSVVDAIPKSCSIQKQVGPQQTAIKIGQSCSAITASDTASYQMKFVTERGKINEFSVNSVGSEPIDLQLLVLPTIIPSEFTATVLFVVKNNMSSNNILTNLVPKLSQSLGSPTANPVSGPDPPQYDTLARGETAIFTWIFKMTGETAEVKTFTASLENGYPGNQVSASATISDVIFAIQSGASIETQGITVPPTADDILMLHQETDDALDGRQMAQINPDFLGFSIDTGVSTTSLFYTNNDTAVNIPTGIWNASLRYMSKPLPDSINTSADMIFHFKDLDDSSGNGNLLSIPSTPPVLDLTCDKDGAACYKFDGINDYLSIPKSTYNDIDVDKDSTAGWFKTPTSSSKQIIYRIDDSINEFYEIYVDSIGKVVFKFNSGAGDVTCTSVDPYDNDAWHLFVAVRAAGQQCELYIDDKPAVLVNNGGGGNQKVEVTSDVYIGIDPDKSSDPFKGWIGYVMHWNNFALSSQNVLDLYNSDYGPNAHQLTFTYEETDKDGTVVGAPLRQDSNYVIPFHDAKGDPTAWATNINYTTITPIMPAVSIDANNRLKFSFTWNSGLNMTMRIDDSTLSNPKSSYIQMPMPDMPFPSYFSYDNDDEPIVNVYNTGPYGSWLTFLTRLTFDDINSDNSFSAHIKDVAGTSMTGLGRDSPLLKVGQTYAVTFEKPESTPDSTQSQGSNIIPAGQYKMYVFFSGHDEQGNIFLRTVYMGPVKVTD